MRAQPGIRVLFGIVASLAVAGVVAAPASAVTQFRVIGKGWGHGIGLSQYGAKGFAERGYGAETIVKYYYTGVSIGSVSARSVDISLRDSMSTASFSISKSGASVSRGGSSRSLAIGDRINVKVSGGGSKVERVRNGSTTTLFSSAASVVTLSGPGGSIRTLFTADNGAYGNHYRGSQRVLYSGGSLRVVNRVGLENYLWGVVPSEMPTSWPSAALRAQAIAARSYAIATGRDGDFDHYSDTRSQVYRGIEEEEVASTNAVNSTKGRVGKYNGNVITAFFHSTSGGRTANIEHVWNTAASPYLKSKADPYESSPYSNWGPLTYTQAAFKSKLGIYSPGTPTAVSASTWSSKRVKNVSVAGTGGTKTLSGSTFQARFGLRSTYFWLERLVLSSTSTPTDPGDYVRLRGSVPKNGTTNLYWRDLDSSTWHFLRKVSPASDGTFSYTVQLVESRAYRLRRANVWGPQVSWRV